MSESVREKLSLAVTLHRTGQGDQAAVLCRQVLESEPDNAEALNLLGVLHMEKRQLQRAAELIRGAVQKNPLSATFHNNLGSVYLALGAVDNAIVSFRNAIALKPDFFEAHYGLAMAQRKRGQLVEAIESFRNAAALRPDSFDSCLGLGLALYDKGRFDEAIEWLQKAVRLKPDSPHAHYSVGRALAGKGLQDEAIAALRRAIELKPDFASAYNELGIALGRKGQTAEAIAALRKAVQLRPDSANYHNNLGVALRDTGKIAEAIECFCKATQLKPDFYLAHFQLGRALRHVNRHEEAIASLQRVIELRPDFAEAYNSLSVTLKQAGRIDEALAACEKAIQLQPNSALARSNKGMLLLLKGEFARAWPEYEWRLKRDDLTLKSEFAQPEWKGEKPEGKTILIHAEQGMGDTLHFIRYASLLAARGAKVIVQCQPELVSLLRSLQGVHQVVAFGEPLPPFDLHVPMLSLPAAFGTTLQTIPAKVPYLHAPSDLVELWRERVASGSTPHAPRLKVGLAWAGSPTHKDDALRSIPLAAFAPLARVKGVSFYSLQKGEAANQAKTPPPGLILHDYSEELKDFSHTAALVANLDLIISVDTAVIHLAGAMARPVWTLLHYVPDWRWMLYREDTPWYPTMRLFRQQVRGDWAEVIQRVATELERYVSSRL